MIQADRVSKLFGRVTPSAGSSRVRGVLAVADVSLTIEPGVVTGLLGPNGAGKTTLIRMMTSFLTPSAGVIRVCGHDSVLDSGAARASIGYLPESAPVYPEMRVHDFLDYRSRIFGVPRAGRRSAIDRALQRCALTDVRARRIGQLSKGYRQRVGLAAAILHDPAVLILDEPSSGLDPSQIQAMRALVRDLALGGPTGKRVVLLSSHILPEVSLTCDRVLIIARGRLRADGTPEQLVHNAASTSRSEYVLETLIGVSDVTIGAIVTRISALAGVESLARENLPDASTRLRVRPTAEAGDLRDSLARAVAVAQPGAVLRELSRRTPTLEEVFNGIVERPDAPGVGS
jgi:ABC-2 type transport system ATP-binding protein